MLDQETEDKYMEKLKNLKSKSSKFTIAKSVEVINIPGSWHDENSVSCLRSFIKIVDQENNDLYIPMKDLLSKKDIIKFSKILLNNIDCSSYSIAAYPNNK